LKIINIVGARPNFMKIAPIQREMSKYDHLHPFLVHTGQHYDDKMSKLFFQDLELPEPDAYLGIGSGTHAEQTARIMVEFEKVAHVEAGLRSFDRTMPEEINRIVTDTLSDYLFVTEQSGLENLRHEGIAEEKIFFTGNVMIDSLVYYLKKADSSQILQNLNLNGYPYALITLHRPSNVDQKASYQRLLDAFEKIQEGIKIVFPMHPRSRKMLDEFGLQQRITSMKNLIITDPIGYLDFIKLMSSATLVLTDSGGIQEETTYLGIPCLTMRENTERPVTVEEGTNIIVGSDSQKIVKETYSILAGRSKKGSIPALWDARAAQRIVEIILKTNI
jgi:UDP-N-acetylglucosamine 2-epimerase (non-hydrolysing)